MHNKRTTLLLMFTMVLTIGFGGGCMRKNLPFQEIISLDGGIAVINASKWYNDSIQIKLLSANTDTVIKSYDKDGLCLFQGLTNNQKYTIVLKRTDLKGKVLYKKLKKIITPKSGGIEYIVLVGASVGKSWEFEGIPERVDLKKEVVLGNRTKYDFDKGDEIERLIRLPFPISGVIIKECAAYFPRDIESSKKQIKTWVRLLREKRIKPVLATVVPVTKKHDTEKPNRFDSIIEFNDFIRRYAYREKIEVLDLEKALRESDKERHLREDYAQPDGLHLVQRAYDEALDKIAVPLITKLTK